MESSNARSAPAGLAAVARLNSWKEIAAYLNASVRTVQRWERTEELPVHRHEHANVATIYGYKPELDAWLAGRSGISRNDRSLSGIAAPRRLIVLPFRLIQADPEIEFLSFGLADAITASLAGCSSLSVRSSMLGAKYAADKDLERIAEECSVDVVVIGTLLRSAGQLRVTVQLVTAGNGTAVWSSTVQRGMRDVFQLQDEVAGRIAHALALPGESQRQPASVRDVPANPAAYEFYLRANELAHDFDPAARDLFERCLEADPAYAPAWARLGRCCRIIAKFGGDPENFRRAEAALARALELRPDLALAHNQLAYLEADSNLADRAMARLLSRAKTAAADAELFAGLVHVCRYCGLLEASISAHERACKLDPTIRTSVCHTHFLLGDYHRALQTGREVLGYVGPLALLCLGRRREAVTLGSRLERTSTPLPLVRCFFSSSRALAEGKRAEAIALANQAASLIVKGPEELFQQARHLAYFSENSLALALLARAVREGFFCFPALVRDPWLHSLRGDPEFEAIVELALERHRAAVRKFAEHDGELVLGAPPPV